MKTAGEIYFIGEKDLRSKEISNYFKVGIVRDNLINTDRDSTQRLQEHQTGNPRELYIEFIVKTERVESVETLLHKKFAPLGVRGEWMFLEPNDLERVKNEAIRLSTEAAEVSLLCSEADELARKISDDQIIAATEDVKVNLREYLEANAKFKACKNIKAEINKILKDALEDENEKEDIELFAKVQERRGSLKFDDEGFRAKYPGIYQDFVRIEKSIKGNSTISGARSFDLAFSEFDLEFATLVDSFDNLIDEIESGLKSKEKLHEFSLELLRFQAEAEWERLKAESLIKVACGTHAGIDGIIKWVRTEQITEKLDKAALTEAHPDLVGEFTTQAEPVTAVKVDPKKGY